MAQIEIAVTRDGESLEAGAAHWRTLFGGEQYFQFGTPVYMLEFNDPADKDRWLVLELHIHDKGVNADLHVFPEDATGDWRTDTYSPLFPRMEDVTLTPLWPVADTLRVWYQ